MSRPLTPSDGSPESFGHVPEDGATDAPSWQPPGAAAGSGSAARVRPRRSRSRRLGRRVAAPVSLGLALLTVGGVYALAAQAGETPTAVTTSATSLDVEQGRQLYLSGCQSCHGLDGQGIDSRGPSLIGVGSAAVEFQMLSGRMPLADQGAQAPSKPTTYTEEQIAQIGAFVESLGGGPTIPEGDLRDGELALGGELFRLNCASCHNFAGRGAPLSAGKFAPNLAESTDEVIYGAMLTGPENMPVFGDNQIPPAEKKAIINYIQTLKETKDPGGANLGRLGPVPEGLVAWVVGITALVFVVMWIGAKA